MVNILNNFTGQARTAEKMVSQIILPVDKLREKVRGFMKEKFKCPICGHINFVRQPTWEIPLTCEKCGHNFVIEEDEDEDEE